MKKMMMVLAVLFAMVGSSFGVTKAGEFHVTGTIDCMQAVEEGFIIRMENGVVPTRATATHTLAWGYLLVKQENKAMTAMALHCWSTGKAVTFTMKAVPSIETVTTTGTQSYNTIQLFRTQIPADI